MTQEQRMASQSGRPLGVLIWIGRMLLLVPEALLIIVLICAYLALDMPPLIGLLVTGLIIGFIVRTVALFMARISIGAARYRQAEALLQIALALYPWSADALGLRGILALTRGNPELALQLLRRALRLLPGQPSFYAALSAALLDLHRPAEAALAARHALALDQRCAIAYLYLAEAERSLGSPALEIEDQLRAGLSRATHPSTEAALRCALAGHLLEEHRVAEATLTLHGAEALLPQCNISQQAELRFHLGELLISQGQIEHAREVFHGIEAFDPNGRYSAAVWRASHLG